MASCPGMNGTWIMALLAGLVSCSVPPSQHLFADEPDPRKAEYVIGPSDEISISVWGVDELNATARVRPDGTITFPLIGDVPAAGRTPSELRSEVRTRLKTYVKDESAVVSLVLTQSNSYRVVVSGRVNAPGVVESDHFLTLNEAVVRAGGPTPFAREKRVVLVRRRPDGSTVRIPIRYDLVASGLNPEQNLVLLPDDQIYFP